MEEVREYIYSREVLVGTGQIEEEEQGEDWEAEEADWRMDDERETHRD